MKLIEDVGFDHSFSFVFSARPGTPAAALPDDLHPDVKLARLQRLQAAIEANGNRISAARVGTVQPILVEGPSRKNPERMDRPHGMQSSGQLLRARRRSSAGWWMSRSPRCSATRCVANWPMRPATASDATVESRTTTG